MMTAVGVSVLLGLAGVAPAAADDTEAKTLFKAMSDYLGAQATLSFDYDSDLEVVTKDEQKLALASSGAMTLKRPDQLRAERKGGFADVEVTFDGKTVSVLGKDDNVYAQAEAPGTLDQLVDTLRDKFERPIPGADLLLTDVYGQLMPDVKDVKDLGSGVIGGVECNHLAFRTDEVDWQLWIAAGDKPLPCRYIVTSKSVAGFPQYTVEFRNWKTGADVAAVDFAFTAPENGKKMELADLPDADELPGAFKLGDKQ
jgi:hypothetical protein